MELIHIRLLKTKVIRRHSDESADAEIRSFHVFLIKSYYQEYREKEAADNGGNYEKGMYNQLMEVVARLNIIEDSLRKEKGSTRNILTG